MRMPDALRSRLVAAGGCAAPAAVIARVVAPATVGGRQRGSTSSCAPSLGDPTLGWGLDLGYDPPSCCRLGAPVIGPPWIGGVRRADGDGLAGDPRSTGSPATDVLLATVHFQALALGITQLRALGDAVRPRRGLRARSGRLRDACFQSAQVTRRAGAGTTALLAARPARPAGRPRGGAAYASDELELALRHHAPVVAARARAGRRVRACGRRRRCAAARGRAASSARS